MTPGNHIGILLAVGFFLFIIITILTHAILTNLFALAIYLLLNIFLVLILPRVFPHNVFINSIKEGFEQFGRALNFVIVSTALVIVYFIGVGFVWVVSRIVGKTFLPIKATTTTWRTPNKKQESFKEMF